MTSSLESVAIKRQGYRAFAMRAPQMARDTHDVTVAAEQRADLLGGAQVKHAGDVMDAFTLLVNKGHDDEMQVCGYRATLPRRFLTAAAILLTGGLLRLFFHWMPQVYLKSRCVRCDISEAHYVLITEVYNETHKQYYVKTVRRLTPETIAEEDSKRPPPLLSVHFGAGHFRPMAALTTFACKKVTYIWDDVAGEFVKLRGLDDGVSSRLLHDVRGLSAEEARTRRAVFGRNAIVVPQTPIVQLLFLEVLNPFYVFQLFSFALWFADNYYFYAAAIFLMSVFGVSMSVVQTRRNQRNLRSTVHSSDVCTVRRDNGVVEVISTELLVPGDVLEIPPHGCVMPCDALLLAGNCILNESMLTGESVPVTKTPFPQHQIHFEPKEHARHTLFCGTHVIQTRYFGGEKVLAVVVRTGFQTAKGALVRAILHPPPVDYKFETDAYKFVALLAGIATVGFTYTVVSKVAKGVAFGELLVEALDLVTIVVPPALPAAMTVGRLYAQTRLQRAQIFCISPRTINVSGSIDCVCFDKTGTLTEDGLDLLCVVPVFVDEGMSEAQFQTPVNDVAQHLQLSSLLLRGLVSCHSLTIIDKQITGDPLDVKMFESTGWRIEEPEVEDNTKFDMIFPTVFMPSGGDAMTHQIAAIREFPFSSSAQRMGVIIRQLGGAHFEYYAKGSPETILNFVHAASVPEDFSDVLEHYTRAGYRVIAMAHKLLRMSYAKAQKVQREALENEMTLLGLIVLENRLKADTTPCIAALNDARIRVVMVTGDNILTAVSVARDCGIVAPAQSVISVNVDQVRGTVYYTLTAPKEGPGGPEDKRMIVMSNSSSLLSLPTVTDTVDSIVSKMEHKVDVEEEVFNNYRFAMTGKVWAVIREEHSDLIPKLVTRGSIFARMAPDQKQQLVQELQALGYYVGKLHPGNRTKQIKIEQIMIEQNKALTEHSYLKAIPWIKEGHCCPNNFR